MYQTPAAAAAGGADSGRNGARLGGGAQAEDGVVVVDQRDLPVAHVDVVRHLDERRLGRGHHAERVAQRAAVAPHHLEEQIGRARLIALQDGVGQPVGRRDGHGYFSAVRMAAGPPFILTRPPVSLSVVPSHENTQ